MRLCKVEEKNNDGADFSGFNLCNHVFADYN